jgi:hypothetical protein
MRVLVCGDRNWTNKTRMWEVLNNFHKHVAITCIIEGEATGADRLSTLWAALAEVQVERFPAQWSTLGRAAGPVRNKLMLEAGPSEVLAFHNSIAESKGTKDMLRRAQRAGIRCVLYTDTEEYINEEIPL